MRNPFGRWRRPLAALAALMATLALGLAGPALPGVVPLFGWGGLGLLLAGCAGMLSWHGARMRSTPAGRAGDPGAALPASILALAVPGLGAAALLVPVALSIRCASRDSDLRLPALAVLSGLLAMLCTVGSPLLGALACAAIPLLAGLSTRGAALVPANDNPSMERPGEIWALLPRATYANHKNEDTESGTWGVA